MKPTADDILDHATEIRKVRSWRQFTGNGDVIETQMIERFKRTFTDEGDE